MTMQRRLLLVDGSAVMHRAYHALPGLTDKQGRPTGALYGFVRILLKAIKELQPTHVTVAFDRPEPTFRKSLYIGYQSQRRELDEDLGEQFGRIRILLEAINIPVYDQVGYEADDIIGSLAISLTKNEKRETEIIILTGDKDLMQLVNDHVKLYMPVKGVSETELIDSQKVKEKLGVLPELVIDLKALTGDNSDNYPGVPGIGPKTATDLLQKFGSFKAIYSHLPEISSETLKTKLTIGQAAGELSQELATIKTDLEVDFNWESAEAIVKQPGKLTRVLENFGFPSLIKQLGLETLVASGQLNLV